MKSSLGSLCSFCATVLGILGGIGVFISACTFANNIPFPITLLIGGFFLLVSCLPLAALGQLLNDIEYCRDEVNRLHRSLDRSKSEPDNPTQSSQKTTSPIIRPAPNTVWHCLSCGQPNDADTRFCKGCSKYR